MKICGCINIEIGTYDNQAIVLAPSWFRYPSIGLDRCIALEIIELWAKGIQTTGHCCGHNLKNPFIGVIFKHIPKMKALGYEVAYNNMRPKDEDSFTPKTCMIPMSKRKLPMNFCWHCSRGVCG